MTTADRYTHLVKGFKRSKEDWSARLSHSLMEEMMTLGALEIVEKTDLHGFEGRFSIGDESQDLRLHLVEGNILADPVEGGFSIPFERSDLVFVAKPEKLFAKIAENSGFVICKLQPGQSPMVACAERVIEGKVFKALIVLDSTWINSFGARNFVDEAAKGAEAIVLLVDQDLSSFPWNLEGKIDRRVDRIPTKGNIWRIDRDWYCHPRFGISINAVVSEYPEKKIIFDGVNKKIHLFGNEINLSAGSRTYNFLRGLCLMGTSSMATDMFAQQFLGYHQADANEIVRSARTHVGKAIKKSIQDSAVLSSALALCLPETPNKTVKSAFKQEEILILGS